MIDEFDPFSGKPSAQDLLTRGFFGPEVHIEHAKRSRDIYERWLSWIAIKDNLLANGLFGTRDLVRLDVHYGFLSAFVHPAKSACELAYGRDEIDVDPPYDHYSAELALLYVVVLAAGELRALGRMSKRAPRVGVRDWSEIEEGLQEAESVSSHLWFPPDQGPHQFDRVEEANHRSTRRGLPIRRGDRVLPEQLTDRMVRYYRNPLERLIRMHSSFVEGTTGIAYRSPWERPDALHRRV